MRWLAYTWRVLVNLFYLAVVAAVLLSIKDPAEKAIISVLGMLYVLIRSQAIVQAVAYGNVIAALSQRMDQIYYRLDGTFEMPDYEEARALIDATAVKLYIDGTFLSVVGLACLWAFFTAH